MSKRAKKKERASHRRRRVAVGAVAAIGASTASMFVAASPAAAACHATTQHQDDTPMRADGFNYWFGSGRATKASWSSGCADTNVSYSKEGGYMRGRYYKDGAWLWGNAQVWVTTAGNQSPWKVIISGLQPGRLFHHGHNVHGNVSNWRF